MANEAGNYIHNRAQVDGKPTFKTLSDASRDAVAAYSRVSSILQSRSSASYELWRTFVSGYMYVPLSFSWILPTNQKLPERGISVVHDIALESSRSYDRCA